MEHKAGMVVREDMAQGASTQHRVGLHQALILSMYKIQFGCSSRAHFSTRVWNMFQAVDRGGDGYGRGNGQIDVSELREHSPCT